MASELSNEAVLTQLDRILSSKQFRFAKSQCNFLRYTISETLAKRGDKLKAYSIALSALSRPATFDPEDSNIVRQTASYIRNKLEAYYNSAGRSDPILIAYPGKGYQPEFSLQAVHESVIEDAAIPRCPSLIAVLPFQNLTGLTENVYLCDGMADELTHQLTAVRSIRIVARTSAFSFRDLARPVAGIVASLGVDLVIEGSIKAVASGFRAIVTIVRGQGESIIHSESFDFDVLDLLRVHASIAAFIFRSLNVDASDPLLTVPIAASNSENDRLWALARWQTRIPQQVREAIRKLIFAECASENPKIQADLGLMWCTLSLYTAVPPKLGFRNATGYLRNLRLESPPPEAWAVRAVVRSVLENDWAGAQMDFRSAGELYPNCVLVHQWMAVFNLLPQGEFAAALSSLEQARSLDPKSELLETDFAGVYNALGDHDEALSICDRLLAANPLSFRGHWMRGLSLESVGKFEEAAHAFRQARSFMGEDRGRLMSGSIAHASARGGDIRSARAELANMETLSSRDQYVSAYDFALAYTALGEDELAHEFLEKAYEERSVGLTFAAVDPRFRRFRGCARFEAVLQRLNLKRPAAGCLQ